MASVVSGGVIGGSFTGTTPNYNLIDTGIVGTDAPDALAKMMGYIDTSFVSPATSASLGDNTLYFDMPSTWKEQGFPATTSVGMVVDIGLVLSVNGFTDPYGAPNFSDKRPVNGYSNFRSLVDGGFFISMSPDASDTAGSYVTEVYTKGVLLTATFNSKGTLYLFTTNTSETFFFHTGNFTPIFGPIAKGTRAIQVKGTLERFKVYSLRSVVSTAYGVVEDAVGNPAANCIVYMFRRNDGRLLGRGISNSLGQYEMMTNAITGDEVFMVCLDNDAAPDFEGLIYDRVTI